MSSAITRRSFLSQTALTASLAHAWSARSYAAIDGANERVRLGIIGCGGMAGSHMAGLLTMKESDNVEIAAVCDIYQKRLLEGVRSSLELLSQRHQTILFTKGSLTEQNRKIKASGLEGCFRAIEIVREKSVDAFQEVIGRHRLSKPHTWMVGNSPRSDINPAVAAGIRAFYIPHAWTWEREREDLCVSDQVTVLDRFSDLLEHV